MNPLHHQGCAGKAFCQIVGSNRSSSNYPAKFYRMVLAGCLYFTGYQCLDSAHEIRYTSTARNNVPNVPDHGDRQS